MVYSYSADVFEGVESVVDVGGGDGTTLGMLVKAFPWIKGIHFDLPHVVSVAPERNGVEHIGGDMFKVVHTADAAFLMVNVPGAWVDWKRRGDHESLLCRVYDVFRQNSIVLASEAAILLF
ncbi:hypothetical protein Syun_015120 [Stephania yunnanensis]|uniref:O-methyltransferase C-terminal domain-containing protein n=1 Tax=Stephania yunnanensis TaxID=152371 RepID=A0AAP0PCJ8_9MAGN